MYSRSGGRYMQEQIEKLSEAWRLFTLPVCLSLCMSISSNGYNKNVPHCSRSNCNSCSKSRYTHFRPPFTDLRASPFKRTFLLSTAQHTSACHIIDLFSIISPSTPLFSYDTSILHSLYIFALMLYTRRNNAGQADPPNNTWTECAHHSSAEIGLTPLSKGRVPTTPKKCCCIAPIWYLPTLDRPLFVHHGRHGWGNTIRPVLLLAFVDVY